MSTCVQSRTCDTLPANDSTSGSHIVWMESMTRISGTSRSSASRIARKFVSGNTSSVSAAPTRCARSFVCAADSSPHTYTARAPRRASVVASCSSSVDLPAPGGPPSSTRLPGTIPPPSSASNSAIPVRRRATRVSSICGQRHGPGDAQRRDGARVRGLRRLDDGRVLERVPRLARRTAPEPARRLEPTPGTEIHRPGLGHERHRCASECHRPGTVNAVK